MNISARGPLHFLAEVALSHTESFPTSPHEHTSVYDQTNTSRSASSTSPSDSSSPTSSVRFSDTKSMPFSNSSNRVTRHALGKAKIHNTRSEGRKPRGSSESQIRFRLDMKSKRKALMERASKIKSLDNSPVNDRQLLVLRMVYDEITMYPCESWMVLLAIILKRAFKQIKNWFSNERQKTKGGEVISVLTDDGDKVRLKQGAFELCANWSDSFFNEVVMVYHFKIMRNSQEMVPVS